MNWVLYDFYKLTADNEVFTHVTIDWHPYDYWYLL